ncbi:PG0541 family transporter-associated protein [Treponema sp.]|uniref:PG0541 family transporter-associated protein n=1 Tax=Treponema sp. TaxID=166 RepID=UPI0038904719
MTRAEIIANQSVQDEIISLMEEHIEGVLYTIIPMAVGRGKKSYKMGDGTWPETNFVLFSYMEDEKVPVLKAIIKAVKEKFTNEGIKLFLVKAEEI